MKIQMIEVRSSYKRKQVNIDKAVPNSEVSRLLQLHYRYLHSRLVKSDRDEGIFNDTYLKLTYNYNPSKDFIEQYIYYFQLLKGAYYRDDKVANYYVELVEVYDKVDTAEYSDTSFSSELDTAQPKRDKRKLTDLKKEIQSYAISQKAYKRKTIKSDKKS